MRSIMGALKRIVNGDRWVFVTKALFQGQATIDKKIRRILCTLCSTYQSLLFYWGVLSLTGDNEVSTEEMNTYYKILIAHVSASVWMELWSAWKNTAFLIPLTQEEKKEEKKRMDDEKNALLELPLNPALVFDFTLGDGDFGRVLGNIRWFKLFSQMSSTFFAIKFLGKYDDNATLAASILLVITGGYNVLSQYSLWRTQEKLKHTEINESKCTKLFVELIPAICTSLIYWDPLRNFAGMFPHYFLNIPPEESTAYDTDVLLKISHLSLMGALTRYKYKVGQHRFLAFMQQSQENNGKYLDVWALLGALMHGGFRGGICYVALKKWDDPNSSTQLIVYAAVSTFVSFFSSIHIYFNHADVRNPLKNKKTGKIDFSRSFFQNNETTTGYQLLIAEGDRENYPRV